MIEIDYNVKKKKGIISGDHFDLIREHFSVENPAAKFMGLIASCQKDFTQ